MNVFWLPRALRRLEQVRDYTDVDNPTAAIQTVRRIFECAERLSRFPEIGRKGTVAGTRQFAVPGTPFLLIYRVRRNQIEILTVLHGARKWPDLV